MVSAKQYLTPAETVRKSKVISNERAPLLQCPSTSADRSSFWSWSSASSKKEHHDIETSTTSTFSTPAEDAVAGVACDVETHDAKLRGIIFVLLLGVFIDLILRCCP